jgi:hypothetical protein
MARFGYFTPEPGRLKTVASNRSGMRDELNHDVILLQKRAVVQRLTEAQELTKTRDIADS